MKSTEKSKRMRQIELGFGDDQRVHTGVATINPKEKTMTTTKQSIPSRQANYDQFIAELTRITRQYGVAIQSVGGVFLADAPAGFGRVTYIADITSGDLYPEFPDT